MRLVAIALILCTARTSWAQEISRAEEYEAQRRKKAAEAAPSRRSGVEAGLLWVQEKKLVEKLETPGAGYKGIRPKFGGLSTGSGFAFGAIYDKVRMLDGQMDFSVSGAASLIKYQQYEVKFDFPRLADNHVFLTTSVRRRVMPREDYFGLGPDSVREERTDYFYEDNTYGVNGGVRPISWLRLGGGVEFIQPNVKRGTDVKFPDTEDLFSDQNSPGLSDQPDFLKSQASATVDWRDSLGNPRRGGYYFAGYSHYNDRSFDAYDFRRLEFEVQQYIPFNEGHRVIAFRFRSSSDDENAGARVPFYMQKSLGGSNDLRGYREFRFRDKNQILFNLEYRWEAFSGLDMAIFGDAGKVFASRSDYDLHHLKPAFGFGLRFNTVKNVFLRLDFARSREGTRTFITFNNVF